jgi:hypothetical protein
MLQQSPDRPGPSSQCQCQDIICLSNAVEYSKNVLGSWKRMSGENYRSCWFAAWYYHALHTLLSTILCNSLSMLNNQRVHGVNFDGHAVPSQKQRICPTTHMTRL